MPADFFDDQTTPEQDIAEKIHIGDDEFDPDEAKEYIKLGRMAKEAQEKYNTDFTKVYPQYTRTTQENKDLREKLARYEQQEQQQRVQNNQLTDEERIALAKQEASRMGFVTDTNVNAFIQQEMEARDLLNDVNDLVAEAKEMGIDTNAVDILGFMKDEDYKNPYRAFEDMYPDQISAYRQRQLEAERSEGLYTTDRDGNINRQPERREPMTDDLMDRTLAEIFG